MNRLGWMLLAAGATALLACGSDPETGVGGGGDGGAGGAGGSPATTTTTTTTATATTTTATATSVTATTTATGTGGGNAACEAPAQPPSGGSCITITQGGTGGGGTGGGAGSSCTKDYDLGPNTFGLSAACESCAETKCCESIDACAAKTECDACLSSPDQTTCANSGSDLDAIDACLSTECEAECTPPVEILCNPVTNEGCAAGEACDFTQTGFRCYEPPNDQALCDECGESAGFCQGTMTCAGNEGTTCAKFCCTDEDCGNTGTCDKESLVGTPQEGVGICL